MIGLHEHNRQRMGQAIKDGGTEARPNGISCPECKGELVDSSPQYTYTSSPPKKAVACPACGYEGYRIL